MTVAENVALGGRGRYEPERARERVREASARSGLAVDPDARVSDLPVGAQQRVEILKAIARGARILILDEPTAVLTPAESRELLERLRAFAREGGTAILITHKLRDALGVADDVTVLRHGRTVWRGPAAETDERSLVDAMVGAADVETRVAADHVAPLGAPTLTLDDVTVRDARGHLALDRASIGVRGGELVGIAAVEGSGQHELLRVLAGRLAPTSGRVFIPSNVGFVPEDRRRDALIGDLTLVENVALRGAGSRRGGMPWDDLGAATAELLARYDVRGGTSKTRARALSGGNQQKLVVGRELEGASPALVVENPSRGLDFNATAAVHARLRAARDAGTAVVLYSSDLDELLALADRVVVVHAGRLRDVAREREAIGRAMLGAETTDG
jgi:simple sugar transport system ATP-binding protein